VDTLAAFVAWICCERLRVATCGLRENFRNSYRISTGGIFMRDPVIVVMSMVIVVILVARVWDDRGGEERGN
jgi:hypothetical protein